MQEPTPGRLRHLSCTGMKRALHRLHRSRVRGTPRAWRTTARSRHLVFAREHPRSARRFRQRDRDESRLRGSLAT